MTARTPDPDRRCAVCDAAGLALRWRVPGDGTEQGVSAAAFRPSSERFGETAGDVLECSVCGHGALAAAPEAPKVSEAYQDAVDEVSLREADGQVATADRALRRLEQHVLVGRLLDIGCWTGSFLVAGERRGWKGLGVEPSSWASGVARERGVDVLTGELADLQDPGPFRAIALCDVLEHLTDVRAAVSRIVELLEPGGALYLTVPDAGSGLARVLGRRWWSVLPMHLQYFTRTSMLLLLREAGLRPVQVGTHAKLFTARYYAERVAGYSEPVGRAAVRGLELTGQADRLVGPDFRDRMEVIAVRR